MNKDDFKKAIKEEDARSNKAKQDIINEYGSSIAPHGIDDIIEFRGRRATKRLLIVAFYFNLIDRYDRFYGAISYHCKVLKKDNNIAMGRNDVFIEVRRDPITLIKTGSHNE